MVPKRGDRQGTIHGVNVSTSTVLAAGKRAGMIAINFENKTKQKKVVPIQFNIKGGLDYVAEWSFDTSGFYSPIGTSVYKGSKAYGKQ